MIVFFDYNDDETRTDGTITDEADGHATAKDIDKYFKISPSGVHGVYIQDETPADIKYNNVNWNEDDLVDAEKTVRLQEINEHTDDIETPFNYSGKKFSGKPRSWRGLREAIDRGEPGYEFPLDITTRKGGAFTFADQAAWDAFDDAFYARRKYLFLGDGASVDGETQLKIDIKSQTTLAGLAAVVDNRV